MRWLLACALALVASAAGAAGIERYKTFINETQSARAAFEQKVYDRNGKLVQESRGNFVLQRPGRFRWVYDKPADQGGTCLKTEKLLADDPAQIDRELSWRAYELTVWLAIVAAQRLGLTAPLADLCRLHRDAGRLRREAEA